MDRFPGRGFTQAVTTGRISPVALTTSPTGIRWPRTEDFVWNLHLSFEPADSRTESRLRRSVLTDPWLCFLERTWLVHNLAFALVIFACLGWDGVAVCICSRTAAGILGHWAIGYACHAHGQRPYDARCPDWGSVQVVGAMYLADDKRVLLSNDRGASWEPKALPNVVSFANDGKMCWASAGAKRIYQTRCGTQDWTAVPKFVSPNDTEDIVVGNSALYVAGRNGVVRLTATGSTEVLKPVVEAPGRITLRAGTDGSVWMIAGGVVYRATGQRWQRTWPAAPR